MNQQPPVKMTERRSLQFFVANFTHGETKAGHTNDATGWGLRRDLRLDLTRFNGASECLRINQRFLNDFTTHTIVASIAVIMMMLKE